MGGQASCISALVYLLAWTYLLPVIGLAAVMATLAGLAFWQYMGHDAAYAAAQKWVQQEFGNFQASSGSKTNNNNPSPSIPANDSMIPLTDEATPDLQIDRNLTLKPNI